jgi:ABC-type phosphate transport system ATPase subunit
VLSSEKQLLCMARAILKRSKVLVMDEVRRLIICVSSHTVTDSNEITRQLLGLNIFNLPVVYELRMTIYSVDYATDELIGKTIRQ